MALYTNSLKDIWYGRESVVTNFQSLIDIRMTLWLEISIQVIQTMVCTPIINFQHIWYIYLVIPNSEPILSQCVLEPVIGMTLWLEVSIQVIQTMVCTPIFNFDIWYIYLVIP